MRLENGRSEWFDVNLGVHRGLVISPLLFAVQLDEIKNNVREGILKVLLQANDLVLVGDGWSEEEM